MSQLAPQLNETYEIRDGTALIRNTHFEWVVHPTFANVRVIPTSVGIHTESRYLDSRANGNDRSTKLQNEVFAISGYTPLNCKVALPKIESVNAKILKCFNYRTVKLNSSLVALMIRIKTIAALGTSDRLQ
jgi:hypothetical protein